MQNIALILILNFVKTDRLKWYKKNLEINSFILNYMYILNKIEK